MSKYTKILLGTSAAFFAFANVASASDVGADVDDKTSTTSTTSSAPTDADILAALSADLDKVKEKSGILAIDDKRAQGIVKAIFGEARLNSFAENDVDTLVTSVKGIKLSGDKAANDKHVEKIIKMRKAVVPTFDDAIAKFAAQRFVEAATSTQFKGEAFDEFKRQEIKGVLAQELFRDPQNFKNKVKGKELKDIAEFISYDNDVRLAARLESIIGTTNEVSKDKYVTLLGAPRDAEIVSAILETAVQNYPVYETHFEDGVTADSILNYLRDAAVNRADLADALLAEVRKSTAKEKAVQFINAETFNVSGILAQRVKDAINAEAESNSETFIANLEAINTSAESRPQKIINLLKTINTDLAKDFQEDEEQQAIRREKEALQNQIDKLTQEKEAALKSKTETEKELQALEVENTENKEKITLIEKQATDLDEKHSKLKQEFDMHKASADLWQTNFVLNQLLLGNEAHEYLQGILTKAVGLNVIDINNSKILNTNVWNVFAPQLRTVFANANPAFETVADVSKGKEAEVAPLRTAKKDVEPEVAKDSTDDEEETTKVPYLGDPIVDSGSDEDEEEPKATPHAATAFVEGQSYPLSEIKDRLVIASGSDVVFVPELAKRKDFEPVLSEQVLIVKNATDGTLEAQIKVRQITNAKGTTETLRYGRTPVEKTVTYKIKD